MSAHPFDFSADLNSILRRLDRLKQIVEITGLETGAIVEDIDLLSTRLLALADTYPSLNDTATELRKIADGLRSQLAGTLVAAPAGGRH